MPFVFKRLALVLSIATAFAADKHTPFKAEPAASYASHQTNAKITMGVDPYVMGEKVKVAFGKVDPYQNGILPVLVVIENAGNFSIKLDGIHAEYVGPNGDRVDATPAHDVRYANGPRRPGVIGGPAGQMPKIIGKKNPLDAWEIEGRALAAGMLPPGQSASGFLYFQTGLQRGATIYIRGLTNAATGEELMFFELPLSSDSLGTEKKK
ncbi:MAG TPA: hypothetical protein VHW09_29930 [Bryobacteraceae bacterium]|jgi:hypothetical protein|nr:hypothetical protein [Bryobacteraceae bacterium]